MARYFRVLKDTFLWNAGAIISENDGEEEYTSINRAFDRLYHGEVISADIVEDVINSEFFEEVYPFETGEVDEEEEEILEFKDKEGVKQWQHASFIPKK